MVKRDSSVSVTSPIKTALEFYCIDMVSSNRQGKLFSILESWYTTSPHWKSLSNAASNAFPFADDLI